MQNTGKTIQVIAIIITTIMLLGTIVIAIALAEKYKTAGFIGAIFLGLGPIMTGTLLYGVGKIVEGVGYIACDAHNQRNNGNTYEEELPNL